MFLGLPFTAHSPRRMISYVKSWGGLSIKIMFALLVKVQDEEHCHKIISFGHIHLTLMCNIRDRYDGLKLFDHNGQTKDQGQYLSYAVCRVCKLQKLLFIAQNPNEERNLQKFLPIECLKMIYLPLEGSLIKMLAQYQ